MFGRSLTVLLGAMLLSAATPLITLSDVTGDTLKTATAFRTQNNIHIDGVLNESDWKKAEALYGFRQDRPTNGASATESTLVKIIYDDEALYVGFWSYDSEPDRIIKQLTRRDRFTASDRVAIEIDSHHDHQSGYHFDVNAAGVKRDILIFNTTNADDSWDAVWEADVSITDWGWMAEMKIPYSAIRFSSRKEYIWGINFWRWIGRKDEFVQWVFTPENEMGGVTRYGHLVGISDIDPPGRMETMPYLVSYGVTEPDSRSNPDGYEFISDVGVDIKYGISPALTLDATINPDFGQVESDKSVINLSVFETYFEEKRPFFLEGFELFDVPFFNLFYSRRIGKKPSHYVDTADYHIDYPRNTTILGAAKLTGRIASKTSIAVLNAVTQEEKTKYRLNNDVNTYETIVEPMTNYLAARVKQDIGGSSYIGGLFTSVNRKNQPDAFTGSADWQIFFHDKQFNARGIVTGTNNGPGKSGMAAAMSLNRWSGKIIHGNVSFDYYDRKVDWNRLGFINRTSYYGLSSWIQLRSDKEFSIFRYLRLNFNGWYNEHLDDYRMFNGYNVNGNIGFTNNWWIWYGYNIDLPWYDDRHTRGNGLWERPEAVNGWFGGNSSDVKKIQFEWHYDYGRARNGFYNDYSIWVNFKLLSNFEFSIGPSYKLYHDLDYWVGEALDDGKPVFGKLNLDELDINLRGIYTFTRNFTIQWYTQFYFSAGKYSDYRKLINPEQYDSDLMDRSEIGISQDDYNYKSLNLNLIARWEFSPGSALYIVWTHARDEEINDYGDFEFSRDFEGLFSTPQTNTFLVKMNYWWNI